MEWLSKQERGVSFEKKKSKFLNIEQIANRKSIYAISV